MKSQDLSKDFEYDLIENPGDDVLFVENYNRMVENLNKIKSNFPVGSLNGQILEATLPATSETRISHSLKTTPKYRLILGQTGNGVITDVKSKWTKDYVTLYNNGAVEVILIFMVIKE